MTTHLITLPVLTLFLAQVVDAAEFHIAPRGSDANPGTKDQPFQTLERAREPTRRPLLADTRRLPSRLRQKLEAQESQERS
jgi:hypothetical protein